MIEFIVKGDAVGKQRPKATKRGSFIQVYTPSKTVNYENYIKMCFLNANQENYINDEQLSAEIVIYQSIPKSTSKKKSELMIKGELRPTKKPDIDNVIKSVFDALNKLAYKDDTQIVEVTARKHYSNEPRVEIKIKQI